MKCISVILLAIALAQGSHADTITELVEEVTEIINNREAEVGQLIGNLGKEIGQTYGVIENNINQAAQKLTDDISGIGNLVNASLSRAEELGRNIDSCVSDVESSISSLNLDVLKTCQASQELTNALKLIPQVGRLPRQLGSLIPRCLAGVLKDVATVRACLDDGLKTVDDTIQDVNSNARALIDGAVDTANKCIDGAVSEVNQSVSTIVDGLNKCIGDIIDS